MPALYIHIPFCASRCLYCDFYSTTLRGREQDFVVALEHEMEARRDFLHGEPVRTVYLGGGTPSQLGADSIRAILDAVARHFDLHECEEVTMEVNPEDVGDLRFDDLRFDNACPINRISMGVQSMVDSELQLLRRRHSAQRVREAVARLREEGCRNLSLDLMYGLPTQTLESWAYSVDEVLRLHPEHISAYNLIVEPGTRLHLLVERGELTVADDDLCLQMAALLRQRLHDAGYEQYEISNYALPGYHSRHNSSYWNQTPYLGLGPGAHSYDGMRLRCWNEPRLQAYLRGERIEGSETLSDQDLYNERLMLSLRTRWGVSLDDPLLLPHLTELRPIINRLIGRDLVLISDNHLILTTDRGLALADEVIRELMLVD